jgi:protein involved in polysaccharide export with SLBB domain
VIADSGSLKVFVIGAVRNAGKRELENGTKVWEAIEQAGGFEQGISQSAVRLVRQGPEGKVSTVSLDLSGKEKSTDNVELRDKDVVFVPRRNP